MLTTRILTFLCGNVLSDVDSLEDVREFIRCLDGDLEPDELALLDLAVLDQRQVKLFFEHLCMQKGSSTCLQRTPV